MARLLIFVCLNCVVLSGLAQNPDSLRKVLEGRKIDSAYIITLSRLSEYYRKKDPNEAVHFAKRVLKHPDVIPSQPIKSYVTLGLIYAEQNRYDSAGFFFHEAKRLAQKYTQNQALQSILFNGLGLFYKRQGKYEEALKYYTMIDSVGEAGLGKENLAGNRINIANIHSRMGRRGDAIRALYEALPIFESIGNRKGMSYCYNNLGVLLKLQENFERAAYYLTKALELKEQEGDIKGIATSCNELALLHIELNQLDEAMKFSERTISLSRQLHLQELLAVGLMNKGKILRQKGDLTGAEASLKEARNLINANTGGYLLAHLQTETGKLLSEKHESQEAIAMLSSSVKEAEKNTNAEALLNAHLFLSQAYAQNNQHKEALMHFQTYHRLEDSLNSQRLKLDYKRLETQYEVQKKNAEIALLKKDQELQAKTAQRQQAIQTGIAIAFASVIIISLLLINRYRIINRTKRLLEIERVRNTIARDLHDDIGSTMSSINIVSQMALRKSLNNGEATDHFKKISEQSSALMERMSDIVWSINPANDSLPTMIARMKEFAAETLEPKEIQYTFEGIENLNGKVPDIEARRNLFLIFKEAINNAAKYSGGTNVIIRFSQKGNSLLLQIIDNGGGFDLSNVKRGNGLRNMKSRAEALNARLVVESQPSKGTQLELTLPLT